MSKIVAFAPLSPPGVAHWRLARFAYRSAAVPWKRDRPICCASCLPLGALVKGKSCYFSTATPQRKWDSERASPTVVTGNADVRRLMTHLRPSLPLWLWGQVGVNEQECRVIVCCHLVPCRFLFHFLLSQNRGPLKWKPAKRNFPSRRGVLDPDCCDASGYAWQKGLSRWH